MITYDHDWKGRPVLPDAQVFGGPTYPVQKAALNNQVGTMASNSSYGFISQGYVILFLVIGAALSPSSVAFSMGTDDGVDHPVPDGVPCLPYGLDITFPDPPSYPHTPRSVYRPDTSLVDIRSIEHPIQPEIIAGERVPVHLLIRDGDASYHWEYITVPAPDVSTRSPSTRSLATKYTSSYCTVEVDSGNSNMRTDEEYEDVGEFFDTVTYVKDTELFDPDNRYTSVRILFYDTGTDPLGALSYGAEGYFTPQRPDQVVINNDNWYYQGMSGDERALTHRPVVAHEVQHFIETIYHSGGSNMDLWVNEGMSTLAMWYVQPDFAVNPSSFTEKYFKNTDMDFTDFDLMSPNAIECYGGSYTIIKYLFDHFGGVDIINKIVKVSPAYNGISVINTALSQMGYSEDFYDVYKLAMISNLIQDDSFADGKYGYDRFITLSLNFGDRPKSPTSQILNQETITDRGYAIDPRGAHYLKIVPYQERDRTVFIEKGSGSTEFVLFKRGTGGNPSSVEDISFSGSTAEFGISGYGEQFSDAYVIALGMGNGGSYTVTLGSVTPMASTSYISSPASPNTNGWFTSSVSVTLSPGDASYDVYYHWDSGTDQKYTSPITAPEGEHVLHFHARDIGGRHEIEKNVTFKVDTQVPSTSITITPASPNGDNGWYTTQPQIVLTPEDPQDTIIYELKGNTRAGKLEYTGPVDVPEGNFTLSYWGEDEAGNAEDAHSMPVMYDGTTPTLDISVDGEPDDSGWYTSQAPKIGFDLSDSGPSLDVVYYRFQGEFDQGEGEASDDFTAFDLDGADLVVPDGEGEMETYALDEAGNEGNLIKTLLKVDTSPPEVTVTVIPEEPDSETGWYTETPTIVFECEDGAVIEYQWVDETLEPDDGGWVSLSSGEDVPVEEGEMTLWVRGTAGGSGLVGDMIPVEIAPVDTIAPETSAEYWGLDLSEWVTDPEFQIELISSESDASIMFSWDDGFGTESSVYNGPITPPRGTHTLYFWSTDLAGNTDQVQEIDMMFDPEPPSAMLNVKPKSISPGDAVTFTATASTDDVGIVEYFFDFGDGSNSGWVTESEVTHEYTNSGSLDVQLTVKDASGQEDVASDSVEVDRSQTSSGDDDDSDDSEDVDNRYEKDKTDSDGDGVPDWYEEEELGTDPNIDDVTPEDVKQFQLDAQDAEKTDSGTDEGNGEDGSGMLVLALGAVVAIVMIVVVLLLVMKKRKTGVSLATAQAEHSSPHPGPYATQGIAPPVGTDPYNPSRANTQTGQTTGYQQAQTSIIQAQNAISRAQAGGVNVYQNQQLLQQAVTANAGGNHQQAVSLSKRAREGLN